MAEQFPPAMQAEAAQSADAAPAQTGGELLGESAAARGAPPAEAWRPSSFSRQSPRPAPRQAYAAIDLGTNNCRLLIARPAGENFAVVDAFSRVVRLGEGLAQTGRLSQAAMDRALGALQVCADKLRKRNVHLARSVATEACRQASQWRGFHRSGKAARPALRSTSSPRTRKRVSPCSAAIFCSNRAMVRR